MGIDYLVVVVRDEVEGVVGGIEGAAGAVVGVIMAARMAPTPMRTMRSKKLVMWAGRRSDLKVDLMLEVEEDGVYMFEMDEVVYDTCISVLH